MSVVNRIKTALAEDPMRSALYASWVLLSALFLIYAISSWFTASNRLFQQLDALNQLITQNTEQQMTDLYEQLDSLKKEFARSEEENISTSDFFVFRYQNTFDHSFLVNKEGRLVASSFSYDVSERLNLNKVVIPPETVQRISGQSGPVIATTFSLGVSGASQYLPVCTATSSPNAALICIALSTENEKLSWQTINHINDTAIQVISNDDMLLYADPLPMHRRSLLGTQIPSSHKEKRRFIEQARKYGYARYYSHIGLDGIKRMGVAKYLPHFDLVTIVSVPSARTLSTWLSQIAGPLFMLLSFLAVTWFGFRIALRIFQRVQADQKITEMALKEQENTLELLLSNLPGMIYRVRIPDYKVLFITDGCRELLGYSANTFLAGQRSPFDDIHEDDQDVLIRHVESVKNPKKTYEQIFRIHAPNGELKWVLDRGRAICDSREHTYLEGLLLDITEHMLSQQQVEYLATRDPLTELANRYLFNDELVNHIDTYRNNTTLALLFIDLDRFKTINDSLGHQVGDRLLKQVAERLRECVDPKCLLARLGGDEFMVMMVNPDSLEAVEALAHTINIVVGRTYELDYYKLNTSCSIGISMYPQDSSESHILLRNADTAMYNAKAKGGNRYQFYTDEMNQKVNSRLTIETELRRAITDREFELYYQPQVNAHTGELEGAEALVRWIHPTAGMVSPAEFIPVAEETGLIRDIGDWVLETACKTFENWNRISGQDLSVAVNVSVRQLDDSFVLRVQEILNSTGLDAANLELEITESLLMDNVQENVRLLENINRQGIRFAMDDFGTGYSSLSYLKQFPISKLKVDRSFVNDITDDPEDEAIIRAIIAMGQTLKLRVIAEGVENHQQLVLLQNMGCNSYQGYYFSKPLPADDFFKRFICKDQSSDEASAS